MKLNLWTFIIILKQYLISGIQLCFCFKIIHMNMTSPGWHQSLEKTLTQFYQHNEPYLHVNYIFPSTSKNITSISMISSWIFRRQKDCNKIRRNGRIFGLERTNFFPPRYMNIDVVRWIKITNWPANSLDNVFTQELQIDAIPHGGTFCSRRMGIGPSSYQG